MADYWLPSASTAGRFARAAGQSLWPVLVLLEEFWAHLSTPGLASAATGWVKQLLRSTRSLHCLYQSLSAPWREHSQAVGTFLEDILWFSWLQKECGLLWDPTQSQLKVKSSWSTWLSALGHTYVQMSKVEIPNHWNCGFCQMYWNNFPATSPVVQSHS